MFIGREPYWQRRFAEAGLPVIGDDIKSQVGATISHRVLTRLFMDRGVRLDRTYQLNFGGNTDFLNMLERERLESKKISKTNAVTSMLDYEMDPDDVHVGPSDHVPWLLDRKWCYIRMEGTTYGDVPLNAELKLEVWDSPNSAGVITDAIRCLKLGLDRGLKGTLVAPSSYFMKSPPHQIHDDIAFNRVEAFIRGEDNETLVGTEAPVKKTVKRLAGTKAKVATAAQVTAGERRLEAPHRRGAAPSPRIVERSAVLGYRATAWLLARPAGRPGRGGRSASGRRRSYLALAGEAALVERELRARPGPAAGRPARPRAGAARLPRVRALPRRADARCRPARRTRSARLVGNLDDAEPRSSRIRDERRGGGLILTGGPHRQQRGDRRRRSPSCGLPISVVADDSVVPGAVRATSARQRAAVGRHAHPVAQPAGDLRRPAPPRDARPAGRLGLPQRRHPGPLFDAWTTLPAGPATLAAKTGVAILPVDHDPPTGRPLRVVLAEPIDVASIGPGRAPARDPGDRRRARRADPAGARAVVQLQADVAGDRRPRRPTSSVARGDAGRPARSRARPRTCRATRPTRSTADRGRGAAMTLRGRLLLAASWLACRLPEGPLFRVAELAGDLWYRLAPGRAAQARRNLRRVVPVARRSPAGAAPRVRAAATDPRALERLVRSAFRHAARYYLEVARNPASPRPSSTSGSRSTRRSSSPRPSSRARPSCSSGSISARSSWPSSSSRSGSARR